MNADPLPSPAPTKAAATDAAFEERSPLLDGLLPALLLLPGLLLALPAPLALLERDPFPSSTGAGLVALAAAPVALLLLLRPRGLGRPCDIRGSVALGLLLVWGLGQLLLGYVTDLFEARRALVLAAAGLVLFVGGAHLGPLGRRRFLFGLMGLSILWCGYALFQGYLEGHRHLSGTLGNSGPLSQAALAGAVIGGAYAAMRRGGAFLVGLLAFLLFAAHSGRASVAAGTVATLVGLLVIACARRLERDDGSPKPTKRALRLLGLGAVTLVAALLLPGLGGKSSDPEPLPASPVPAAEATVLPISASGGGVEVRWRIWRRAPAVLVAHPFLGLGPGQFAALFPPHRDPAEAIVSRHGVCSDRATEVEHPHNDWILGFLRGGIGAGALWLVFLLYTLRAGVRAARRGEVTMVAAGAAGVALLAGALFHAPLLVSPASAALAFALFGILMEADGRIANRRLREFSTRGTGLIGLLLIVFALPLVRHGAALRDYAAAAITIDHQTKLGVVPDEEVLTRAAIQATEAVERALAVAPDSVPASILAARIAPPDERAAWWDAILALRPWSFEAREQRAILLARADALDEARSGWERALRLDPSHPRILRSLARLEMHAGRPTEGLRQVEVLRGHGCLDDEWLRALGEELLLAGRSEGGRIVLAETDEEFRDPNTLLLNGLAQRAEQEGQERRADALKSFADLQWAREHLANDNFSTAVVKYRRALIPTMKYLPDGAPALRLELAAAQWLAGREEDARRTLEGIEFDPVDLAELPGRARDALEASALLTPRP